MSQLDIRILNNPCHRFIYYCQINLIRPILAEHNEQHPPGFYRMNAKINDWVTIHGMVGDDLVYLGPPNEAEIQLQMHYSKIHTCIAIETGEIHAYSKEKALHYYNLSKLKELPDRIDNHCDSCDAFHYCRKGSIPPFYKRELYDEYFTYQGNDNRFKQDTFKRWVLGKAIAGKLGLNEEQLRQFKTMKELKEFLN